MAYNVYCNPYNQEEDPEWRINFPNNLEQFKSTSQDLVTCGTATNVNFACFAPDGNRLSSFGVLPGQNAEADVGAVTIVYHAYFVAPDTGGYFFVSASDDFGYIWLGLAAYNAWTNSNWLINQQFQVSPGVYLNKGQRIPMTILWANTGGGCKTDFGLYVPIGGNEYRLTYDFIDMLEPPEVGEAWAPPVASGSCPIPPPPPYVTL